MGVIRPAMGGNITIIKFREKFMVKCLHFATFHNSVILIL